MNSYRGLRMYWGLGLSLGHAGSRHDRHGESIHLFACLELLGDRIRTCPVLSAVVIDQCHLDFVKRRSTSSRASSRAWRTSSRASASACSGLFQGTASLLAAFERMATGGIT